MSEADAFPETCATCGERVGAGLPRNIGYFCDELEGMWCGDCFEAVRCEELHGEGCATMVFIGPEDDGSATAATPVVGDGVKHDG